MKYFLLPFAFILTNLMSFAQFENFDLSKYKLPDIKRHQLDFNFQSQGQNSSTFAIYDSGTEIDTFENNQNEFYGRGNMNYSFYRNSNKVQISVKAHTSIRYDRVERFYRFGDGITDNDNSYFGSGFDIQYNIKYFLKNNWFLTTSPVFDISYSEDNNLIENSEWKRSERGGSLLVGGGKGRIEHVEDFRHAILILQKLDKKGIIKRNLSEEEIVELSTLISELKNRRFFDYRKQKEIELTTIDSFLVSNNIINDENSISYFVVLQEMWSYGGRQFRESGNQFTFFVKPRYDFNMYGNDEEYIREQFSTDYSAIFISMNPVSFKWQTNYEFGVLHSHTKFLLPVNSTPEKEYFSRAFVSGLAGFYPNTRTNFDFQGIMSLMHNSYNEAFDNEAYSFQLQLSTSGYYYISERMRLGYNISYQNNKSGILNRDRKNSKQHSFNYYLNLNYAIF